jgi:hypothetical protein
VIVACVIIGLSIFSPTLIAGMGALMDVMSDVYDEMGMDVTGMTELLGSSAAIGVASSVEIVAGTSLIVLLLLINKAAGGEQKKRAMIVPKSAGLRSFPYIFPKFIIYPITAFILAVLAILASLPISMLLFNINDVTFSDTLLAGVIAGVSLMFYVCCHLALGTATGRAGMSAAVCITVSIILPLVFSAVSSDYMFNPFSLGILAASVIYGGGVTGQEFLDIVFSIIFAIGIMVVTYFVALFAQNAKKIDNSGSELEL